MFVQVRRFIIQEGQGDKALEDFQRKASEGPSIVEQQPGFLGRELLRKKVRRGEEEALMIIRWESEEAWKNWEKSPEHIAGHKAALQEGKPKRPDYILDMQVSNYTVVD